jgi:glycine reductase
MLRIVHYINQFFAQIGGEEKAHVRPSAVEGAVGPGILVNSVLKGRGQVVATVICGDTFFAEQMEEAAKEVLDKIARYRPDIVLAGPAFNAGRYGIACGEVCKRVKAELGIVCVTGMYGENPGVDGYRKYVQIVRTKNSALGMREAVPPMISLALKLWNREPVGTPDQEGYFPQGIRKNVVKDRMAAHRAVDLLMKKIRGEAFETEIPFPAIDRVVPPPAVSDLKAATIALVTEGGLVPSGNPDNVPYARATRYFFARSFHHRAQGHRPKVHKRKAQPAIAPRCNEGTGARRGIQEIVSLLFCDNRCSDDGRQRQKNRRRDRC